MTPCQHSHTCTQYLQQQQQQPYLLTSNHTTVYLSVSCWWLFKYMCVCVRVCFRVYPSSRWHSRALSTYWLVIHLIILYAIIRSCITVIEIVLNISDLNPSGWFLKGRPPFLTGCIVVWLTPFDFRWVLHRQRAIRMVAACVCAYVYVVLIQTSF